MTRRRALILAAAGLVGLAHADPAAAQLDRFLIKTHTTDKLTTAFSPIVGRSLDEVGVTRQYADLVRRFESIPFVRTESLDLTRYVTGKGLDGLFHVLGEQEKQIRTNPAARTTDLLKAVFSR